MNVLFVGTGSGGSWEIRGKQIGRALGARVSSKPNANDWDWADLVVLVKHGAEQFGAEAKASGARVVWDVLDWWKQPEQNDIPIIQMVQMVNAIQEQFGIEHLIGATQAMADEIGGVYIPHHYRPALEARRHGHVRERIKVIAYEGTKKYLGSWRKVCEDAAAAIGGEFVVNPDSLADADVVVAFRGEQWDGPICRRWKSGVKLANAIAVGRPVITQRSEAFFEMGPCGAIVNEPSELPGMIELFASKNARQSVLERSYEIAQDFTLETVTHRYRHLFDQVMRKAA